jgi:hypothetical protein
MFISRYRRAIVALGVVTVLAGYGTNLGAGSPLVPNALAGAAQSVSANEGFLPTIASPDLYVANYNANTVTVYALGDKTVLRTISQAVTEFYSRREGVGQLV